MGAYYAWAAPLRVVRPAGSSPAVLLERYRVPYIPRTVLKPGDGSGEGGGGYGSDASPTPRHAELGWIS